MHLSLGVAFFDLVCMCAEMRKVPLLLLPCMDCPIGQEPPLSTTRAAFSMSIEPLSLVRSYPGTNGTLQAFRKDTVVLSHSLPTADHTLYRAETPTPMSRLQLYTHIRCGWSHASSKKKCAQLSPLCVQLSPSVRVQHGPPPFLSLLP